VAAMNVSCEVFWDALFPERECALRSAGHRPGIWLWGQSTGLESKRKYGKSGKAVQVTEVLVRWGGLLGFLRPRPSGGTRSFQCAFSSLRRS